MTLVRVLHRVTRAIVQIPHSLARNQPPAAMHPDKVDRTRLRALTDLPNIGPACARDLQLLGIHTPGQIIGRNPFEMYEALCAKTAMRHDPCVIDVFLAAIDFMNGAPAQPWWHYTAQRKHALGDG